MNRLIAQLTFLLALLSFGAASAIAANAAPANPIDSWVVYYGDALPAETFLPYDLVVFDSDSHPPLASLAGKQLLGYISFGEAEDYRNDFKTIQSLGLLLDENPNWPGHFTVDIRNKAWHNYILEQKIPAIMAQGFTGIMVDTLDSIEFKEELEPEKYKGMTAAAGELIRAIAARYPDLSIMINRGFGTLPSIAKDVDYIMAESIAVEHRTGDTGYRFFPDKEIADYVEKLHHIKNLNPKIQIVSLDYWNMDDKAGVKEVYRLQRSFGFIPYVTTIEIDKHHPEPQ